MRKSTGLIAVVAIATLVGVWMWKKRGGEERSAPAAQSSAIKTNTITSAPVVNDPAHVVVNVRDDKGPIASATVRLIDSHGEVSMLATGGDGAAKTNVEPGEWRISASAKDHEPAAAKSRTLAAGETATFDLVLPGGGRPLTGLVTDAMGGPVVGARVDAAKVGAMARPTDAVASTVTGSDGRYAMTVAEGQLVVAASDPNYAPQSRYVEVGATGAVADFQLVPGGVIEGIVKNEQTREVVPGARVIARRDQPSMMLGERAAYAATAGSDGRFRITGLRPGAYELRATSDKLFSLSPTVVGIGVAEQVADVVILVGTGPTIRGVVVNEEGAPVPNIEVGVFGTEMTSSDAKTDAKGAFELSGLAPGHYSLAARGEEYFPKGFVSVELEDKDLDGVKLTVAKGLSITGHVEPRQVCEVRMDLDDRALGPDLPMLVSPVTTGADGVFEIKPVSAIGYTIVARCPSGDQGELAVVVKPGLPEQVVNVKPGASIAGRVVDGSNKPVAGVVVMAAQQGGTEHTMIVNGMVTSGVQSVTGANGGYELKGLKAGTYRLRVLDRGKPLPMRTAENKAKVTLGATEKKTGVDLAVDRADGVIEGVVVGADGKPIPEAWVSVHQDLGQMLEGMMNRENPGEGGESRMITVSSEDDGDGGGAGEAPPALTDASGKFKIAGLVRQPWTVIAEAQAGKLRGRAAGVKPDATITITAVGLTELSGKVTSPSGPPKTFSVELDGPTRAERSFATADGTFSFGRVDPGAYTVRVTSSAGNGEVSVQVAAGKPTSVDIVLAANAVVVGKLVDSGGKPMGGVPVTVVEQRDDHRLEVSFSGPPPTSNADGTFRVETKAVKSTLVVMTPPRPTTKPNLELAPGKTLDVGTITVAVPKPSP